MPGWDAGRVANQLKKAVEEGKVKPGKALVLGCGTGTNAVFLAQHFGVADPKVAVRAWTTGKQWMPYSMFCAQAVSGKHFPEAWERQVQCMTVSRNGAKLVSLSICGKQDLRNTTN